MIKGLGKLLVLTVLVLGVLIIWWLYGVETGMDVSIENMTDNEICNLTVTTTGDTEEFIVHKILPKEIHVLENLSFENEAVEEALILIYDDASNVPHIESLIGYLDGNFHAKVSIQIISVDEEGLLKLKVDVAY